MQIKRAVSRILCIGMLVAGRNASIPAAPAQAPAIHQTENVVLVMREFIIRDCNGFWITFGQPLKS